MLEIQIDSNESWNEELEEFVYTKSRKIVLEHSLVSVAKWESKWNKKFLDTRNSQTYEELMDYIKCMTITQNVPDETYYRLSQENINAITDYINAPMTAKVFYSENENKSIGHVLNYPTSDEIYYMMIVANIPFECQKWHLNRLMTLLKIFNEKNKPEKKMSDAELSRHYHDLNEARRRKYKTKG